MDASPPTPPELLVLSAYSAGLQQTVRWGPSVDLGIGGVEYGVESSTNASFGSGTVGSGWITASQYTFAGLADGSQYFFRARARDAFGYLSPWSAVRNTTVDDSAPTIAPDQSSVLTSDPDLLLTGTVSDSVSVVAQVMFSTDGGVSWSGTSVVNGSWQASVTGLSEGRTTVLVQAFDTVGHESAIARIEVTVDATAPLVAFTSPTNNTTVTGLVGIYAVIADANFDSFRLQERKVGVANFTDIVANGSAARGDNFLGLWDTRTLANGMYELRLTARDALGQATTRAIQIRVLNSDIAVSYGDLQFSDRMPTAGDTINVTGVVTNFGTAPAENVTVRIKDNGVVVFDRSGLTIGAHASFTAQVAYRINGSGPHAFTIEVSYPEGARDEGTTASATITVLAPPVPEPTPFLIEFADALGPLLILAIVALAVLVGWMFVELRRLRAMPRSGGAVAVSGDNVQMEWDADSTFY
jgi:hypothetical protein